MALSGHGMYEFTIYPPGDRDRLNLIVENDQQHQQKIIMGRRWENNLRWLTKKPVYETRRRIERWCLNEIELN